ncbi:hypothetical protein HLH36_14950 [Gluconacetobacter aggeris]|uniref:Uncharacterized protein n=1 Tax=Gluconacetobacter aggeris TaxID=1286186 RepID=A0A7W4NZH0_9PROT|nr:hypothetical protein [Gluconacetobacter aggeris]MBB2169633.1 hypothetical protein [Gluconacetobacter aggeris]
MLSTVIRLISGEGVEMLSVRAKIRHFFLGSDPQSENIKQFKVKKTPNGRLETEEDPPCLGIDGEDDRVSEDFFSLSSAIPGLKSAVRRADVVDLTLPGALVPLADDGITTSIVVALNPAKPNESIKVLPPKQRYILMREVLQLIKDYRITLQAAFDRLRIGGWLVISVPHQFLAERKYRLPSRYGSSALRLYTPASLIAEIEEALDPTTYRVRLLRDDDNGYNYTSGIHERPEGNQRIIVAIQKLKRPIWADQLFEGDQPVEAFSPADRVVSKAEGPISTHILSPSPGEIGTILVIKLDHRGDYLMAVSAMAELRTRFPAAKITFVCGSWNADSSEKSGYFDEVLVLNFFGEDASLQREPKRDVVTQIFADMMKGRYFDLAIDMRFFDDTRDLLRHVGARFRAGFDRWNTFPWLDIVLTLPSPTLDGSAMQIDWPLDSFRCADKLRLPDQIILPPATLFGKPSITVFGPYKPLKAGKYKLELNLRSRRKAQKIAIDIVHTSACKCVFVSRVMVRPDGCDIIYFDLPEPADDFEIRITCPTWGNDPLEFSGAHLVRLGAIVGVHQREAMYLLIQLIYHRLTAPYVHEIAEEDI